MTRVSTEACFARYVNRRMLLRHGAAVLVLAIAGKTSCLSADRCADIEVREFANTSETNGRCRRLVTKRRPGHHLEHLLLQTGGVLLARAAPAEVDSAVRVGRERGPPGQYQHHIETGAALNISISSDVAGGDGGDRGGTWLPQIRQFQTYSRVTGVSWGPVHVLLAVFALFIVAIATGLLVAFREGDSGPHQEPSRGTGTCVHESNDALCHLPSVSDLDYGGSRLSTRHVSRRPSELRFESVAEAQIPTTPMCSPLVPRTREPHQSQPQLTPKKLPQQCRGRLCPKLVVPDGVEFIFVVREVLARQRQNIDFNIVDLSGNPVCHVFANELQTESLDCGLHVRYVNKERLALVRTSMLYDCSAGLPEICSAEGIVYCRMVHAPMGQYALQGLDGEQLMSFQGDFQARAINGIAPSGIIASTSQRCLLQVAKAPPGSTYYKVRVAPGGDIALLLCGMLAIDKVVGRA